MSLGIGLFLKSKLVVVHKSSKVKHLHSTGDIKHIGSSIILFYGIQHTATFVKQ